MRVPSEQRTQNGGWLHIFRDDAPAPRVTPVATAAPAQPERAPAAHLHNVYVDLIRLYLVLAYEHYARLRARGLDERTIAFNGYKSTPPAFFGNSVARALARDYDLTGVPGFYKRGGVWCMVEHAPGFFVPVHDADRRIVGFQVRRDEGEPRYLWFSSARQGGASSGAPVHFARPDVARATGEAVITEGSLKADCIAALTGEAVIGIAGVLTFGDDFGDELRRRLPELRRVTIAYDADWRTNPNVHRGLTKLRATLRAARFAVAVRAWDAANGKGYDDALAAASLEVAR
jgi:hypothetical protein